MLKVCKLYLLREINHMLPSHSSCSLLDICYVVFKFFAVGFICLCVGIVLYNIYKSKWNPPKYEDIAKLKKRFTLQAFKSLFTRSNIVRLISLITWSTIVRFFARRVNRWLLEIILVIINWNVNILFKFMGVLAIMAIIEYLDSIINQLLETGKIDFSLAYSDMKKKLTINWFIQRIWTFLLGITFKDKIEIFK